MAGTSALWGRQWTPREIADITCPVMEAPDWNAVNCIAIALAESGGYEWATNLVAGNPDAKAYLSYDVGMWQVNTYWHPGLTIADSLTPGKQIYYVERLAKKPDEWGYDWTPWVTWNTGAYKPHVPAAYQAVEEWRADNGLPPLVMPPDPENPEPPDPPEPEDPVTTYPVGYGSAEMTMAQMRATFEPRMEPEYARRLFAWLEWKGGVVGIGSGWRSRQATTSPATQAGKSFHQTQRFADGWEGYCAVDLVVRRPGMGHSSGAVPWSDVPVQGSQYAKDWGLHANVTGESWHLQPIEIDGFGSWDRNGRPRPKPGYAIPTETPPPPGMQFDPRRGIWGLWPLNDNKPPLAVKSFVEARRTVGDNRWQWTGDAVLYLQGVLYWKAGPNGQPGGITIDGFYGNQTKGRVEDLQTFFGLTVDGLVGSQTWKLIDELSGT